MKLVKVVNGESELGDINSSDTKSMKHSESTCKTANTMFGFIAKNFEQKNLLVMQSLYKSWTRLHLHARSSLFLGPELLQGHQST